MSDEDTIATLRRAMDTTVREHHLDSHAATAAWQAAHAPRPRLRRYLAVAASVVAIAAVASAVAITRTSQQTPAGHSACAGAVSTDPLPAWARAGFSPNGYRTPHVLGSRGEILGVLFTQPLRVHQPYGTNNKILWVAKDPGSGPLTIRAALEGTDLAAIRTVPTGPGPSIINLPAAGCWRLTLTWSGHRDTVAIRYSS